MHDLPALRAAERAPGPIGLGDSAPPLAGHAGAGALAADTDGPQAPTLLLEPPPLNPAQSFGGAPARLKASPPAPPPRRASVPVAPAPSGPEKVKTWFELKVVDEIGEPLDDLEINFTSDGETKLVKTDGGGVAHLPERSGRSASARVQTYDDARAELKRRWAKARDGETPPEGPDVVVARLADPLPALALEAEHPRTLAIVPSTRRLRLIGLFFDTDKCFLLPSAAKGIRRIVEVYREDPDAHLLVVGHTDSAGDAAYNAPLSLERAEATRDYLTDDVDAWLRHFAKSQPAHKRWGWREVQLMLGALPSADDAYYPFPPSGVEDPGTHAALERLQGDAGLKASGRLDDATRRELVTRYMALDGTSLPAGATLETHGCGEHFPDVDRGDGAAEEANRRVEIYVFQGAIRPPPAGKLSKKGSKEYPAWKEQVTETIDFHAGDDELVHVLRIAVPVDDSEAERDAVHLAVQGGGGLRYADGSYEALCIVFELDPHALPNPCRLTLTTRWGELTGRPFHPVDLYDALRHGDMDAASVVWAAES